MISSTLHTDTWQQIRLLLCIYIYVCVCFCVYRGLFVILSTTRIRWMTHIWSGCSTCIKLYRNWWLWQYSSSGVECRWLVTRFILKAKCSNNKLSASPLRVIKISKILGLPFVFPLPERTISPQFWTIHFVWNTMLLGGFYSMNSNQMAGIFQSQKRTRKNMSGIAEQKYILQM